MNDDKLRMILDQIKRTRELRWGLHSFNSKQDSYRMRGIQTIRISDSCQGSFQWHGISPEFADRVDAKFSEIFHEIENMCHQEEQRLIEEIKKEAGA